MLALVASADGVLTPGAAHQAGRPVVLAQGGIHAGEIDGKDAGFLLLRRILVEKALPGVLGQLTWVFVPVFNVDGHERFGPHQRLGGIITEAELEPDSFRDLKLCRNCNRCETSCPVGALKDGRYDVDPCFNYWTYGFDRLSPRKLREIPGYIKMLMRHWKRRDILIEYGQTMITDVDFCFECMKACPVGSEWKRIRPSTINI